MMVGSFSGNRCDFQAACLPCDQPSPKHTLISPHTQVLVFIFAAVTFNYGLALISNVLSLGVSIRSMNRFGTNAVAYLEAVKEIAGPTSLDSLTRVQSAIDCMKIASSLEKVDAYLKVRCPSALPTMFL